jgi:PAS domain S-box-containing protein
MRREIPIAFEPWPSRVRAVFPVQVEIDAVWGAIEAAAEQAELGIYVARIDLSPAQTLYASPRACRIVGRAAEQLVGLPPWVILAPAEVQRIQNLLAPPADPTQMRSLDVTVRRPDGTELPVRLGTTRIETPVGLISLGYLRDLSPERDTLAALRQSERRFRHVVEAAPDGVCIVLRGRIVFINERGAQLLANASITDVIGHPIGGFMPLDDAAVAADRIGRLLSTGVETPPTEYRVRCDAERTVEIKAIVVQWEDQPAVLAFARDVTERKRLQHRMVETDRLAALGTLSAGVAHEINNPLTYATLNLQRMERAIGNLGVAEEKLAPLRQQLREIEHGLARVASITRGLRAFARPDDAPPGAVSLADVVDRSLRMVDNDLRHRATLIRTVADVPSVTGNASRLEQVVVNLLLNAIQALPESATNEIEVVVARVGEDRVSLAIRDTGRGIAPAIRDRIFEPFFTTRAVGDGMGLGLSVCRTIVEGFGGTIDATHSDGTGTTMTIVLPIHPGPVEHTNGASRVTESVKAASRKRVLIIDDEPLLRDTLTRVLTGEHDITTACSGADALDKLAAASFDAILCDVMMPGMNGLEVYRRIAEDHPGLERKMVFITGGTFSPEIDDMLAATHNRTLTKPFQIGDVIAAVEQIARD